MQCSVLETEETNSYVQYLTSEMQKRFVMMCGKLVTFDVSYMFPIYTHIYIYILVLSLKTIYDEWSEKNRKFHILVCCEMVKCHVNNNINRN